MKNQTFIYSSCNRPWMVFLAAVGLYLSGQPRTLAEEAKQPPAKQQGEELFNIHCVSCHQKDATGLVGFAPSIRNRDFLALASDEFIQKTIQEGRPGTAMVARPDLTDEMVHAILAYLRSYTPKNHVNRKLNPDFKAEGTSIAGKDKFITYCASCHGPNGEGYMAGVPGTGIGLPGFLAVASDDFILQTLKWGRIGTPMQPFIGARGLANLSEQDAQDIIMHLRHLGSTYAERMKNQPVGPGNPRRGEVHFLVNCAPCHQSGGSGKVGLAPSIRNKDFLALASDDFIKTTMREGRPGTGMVPRADLPGQVVNDIVSYLRDLPGAPAEPTAVNPALKFAGNAEKGSHLFANYCASCHGPNGEGYIIGVPGPGIGLPGFLNVASDDFIFQTIKLGRAGTPMMSFIGAKGLANLAETDVHDIIAHLRVLQTNPPAAPAASEGGDFE